MHLPDQLRHGAVGMSTRVLHRRLPCRAAFVVTAVIAVALAPTEIGGVAEAKRKHKRYCTKDSYPLGCIWVPHEAKRPASIKPQDEPATGPSGYGPAGGVGGAGERERTQGAFEWTQGWLTSKAWRYRSQRFVEAAFAAPRKTFESPRAAARGLRLRRTFPAPRGALMLFGPDGINRGVGHIGLSLGDGRMISALDEVRITNVANSKYWKSIYLGWSHAPGTWPGRLPIPPGLENPVGAQPVSFLTPAAGETFDSRVRLAARAEDGGRVAFAAYYAADPANSETLGWHDLGVGADDAGVQVFDWDTSGVPSQGNPKFGTITVAAIAVDADDNLVGVGDYRRITVLHGLQ